MQLLAIGLNHQTAPLALRERVAFVPDEVGSAIASLRDRLAARDAGQVSEAAIVSTCNRTELYCAVEEPKAAGIALAEFIASAKHLDSGEIRKASYVLPQSNAVRHAFRVASGLESMVIGEPQILGQMKQAEKLARATSARSNCFCSARKLVSWRATTSGSSTAQYSSVRLQVDRIAASDRPPCLASPKRSHKRLIACPTSSGTNATCLRKASGAV